MATKPLPSPLTADLPENWTYGQTVAPTGQEVGLPNNYGYNYLMAKVNEARVSINIINEALADFPDVAAMISAHNLDEESHPYILGLIRDLEARIALLELQYGTDVNGNPFIITFVTLDGVDVTGVWNQPQARMEF